MNLESLIFVSGLSGSGKSTALKTLEDSGYFCMDNFPIVLIPKFLEMISLGGVEFTRLAFVIDIREGSLLNKFPETIEILHKEGFRCEILFLECDDSVIVKRYQDTRRHHPLSKTDLLLGISEERALLKNTKDIATRVIDTSSMNVHQLRKEILNFISSLEQSHRIKMSIISFGFKYGIPLQADFVFDVRFLPNPYFVAELKNKNGLEKDVRDYVMSNSNSMALVDNICRVFDTMLPLYISDRRYSINICIGCTGGLHRSVVIAEVLKDIMQKNTNIEVSVYHRDVFR